MATKRKKKDILDSDGSSDDDINSKKARENLNLNLPNYVNHVSITLENKDLMIKKFNFSLYKEIEMVIGNIEKGYYSGNKLIIQVNDKKNMLNLLKMKSIINGQYKIIVEPEFKIGTTTGLIYAPELIDYNEIEIKENIKSDHDIVEVKRLNKGKDKIKTPLLKITFGVNKLPLDIKIGFINYKVDVYYPAPLRCYNCFNYGHGTKFCLKKKICKICSEEHEEGECNEKLKCINCNQDHAADDINCAIFKQEKAIVKIKIDENVSFREARTIFKNSIISYGKINENNIITKSLEKSINQEIRNIPVKLDDKLHDQIIKGIKKVIDIAIEKSQTKETGVNTKTINRTDVVTNTTEESIETKAIDNNNKPNEEARIRSLKKHSPNKYGTKENKIGKIDERKVLNESIKLNNGAKLVIENKKNPNKIQKDQNYHNG